MIPFLTEIYGFSYHYTANAPTLQEIFIIFLCRHAPFSAGKPARPERRAPGRPGKRPPREADASRGGRARKQTRRLCSPHPQAHSVRHTASLSSKRLGRKFKKARAAGLPRCRKKERAVLSHTKPYPAIGVQSPSGRPRPIAFSKPFRYRLYPRLRLVLRNNKEDMPHLSFSRRSSKPPLRISKWERFRQSDAYRVPVGFGFSHRAA